MRAASRGRGSSWSLWRELSGQGGLGGTAVTSNADQQRPTIQEGARRRCHRCEPRLACSAAGAAVGGAAGGLLRLL